MNQQFISVPFKIADSVSQLSGLGKFSAAGIVLEYESKLFGIIKNGVKERRIAVSEISNIVLKRGILKIGAKIEIRVISFAQLSEIPHKDGKIILNIARENFALAEGAVAKIQESHELRKASQTSIRDLFDE